MGGPKARNGAPVVVLSPATEGFRTWIIGRADNLSPVYPDTGRGTGPRMLLEFGPDDEPGTTKSVDLPFLEPVEVHDGEIHWGAVDQWGPLDSVSVGITIPGNTPVVADPPNTGNVNLVNLGAPGVDVIVPAEPGTGTHVLDMATAIPIEKNDENPLSPFGWWSVEYRTGNVTPWDNEVQNGGWSLFTFPVRAWVIRNVGLGSTRGQIAIDPYKVEYLHPRWRLHFECTRESPAPATLCYVAGWLFAFRENLS